MFRSYLSLAAAVTAAAATATAGLADSTPVGPLPPGAVTTIHTPKGQLVAFALPHRSAGRVWRVARKFDSRVVEQVSEADVGNSVVLVFRTAGAGTTTVHFGLTRGETAKAFESRHFTVVVK
jgi:hypothetical protein